MEVLNFLKWQWNKFGQFEKCTFFVFSVTILVTLIVGLIYGPLAAFGAFLVSLLFTGVITLIVINLFVNPWRNYKAEKEDEAQRIVNKLSGKKDTRYYQDSRGPG